MHPQKKMLLKELLENTMVRMVELKHELVKYNTHHDQVQCDFVHLDELLIDLKLSPHLQQRRRTRGCTNWLSLRSCDNNLTYRWAFASSS